MDPLFVVGVAIAYGILTIQRDQEQSGSRKDMHGTFLIGSGSVTEIPVIACVRDCGKVGEGKSVPVGCVAEIQRTLGGQGKACKQG